LAKLWTSAVGFFLTRDVYRFCYHTCYGESNADSILHIFNTQTSQNQSILTITNVLLDQEL